MSRSDPFLPVPQDTRTRQNEEEAFLADTPENESHEGDEAPSGSSSQDTSLPVPRGEKSEDFRGDEPIDGIKSLAEVDPDAFGTRQEEDTRIGVSIHHYKDQRTMNTARNLPLTTEVHIASIESYLVYSATKITALKGVLPHFILLLLVTVSVLMLRLDGSANDVSRTLTTDYINEESLGDVLMSSQAFEFAEGVLDSFFVPGGASTRHVFEYVDELVGTSSLARKHNDLTFIGLLSFRFLRAELSVGKDCGRSTSSFVPSEEFDAALLAIDDASSTTEGGNWSYCISGDVDYSATPDPAVVAAANYNTTTSAQGESLYEGHHLLGKFRNYGAVTTASAGFNVVQLDLPVEYNDTSLHAQLKLQFNAATGRDAASGQYQASGRIAGVLIDGLVFDSQSSGLTHVSFVFEAQRSGTSVRVVTYPFLLLSIDFTSALNAIAFLVDCFLVLYWIYWIYELFFTLRLNYDLHHHIGSLEWFGFWEMFNIVTFLVSTVYLGLKGYFWYQARTLLNSTETSVDGTELFRSLMSFRDFLEWSLGGAAWLVMLIYLRSFFFLRFSFRLSTVSETIGSSRHEMTGVMLIFVMVFVAYGYAGSLIFGTLRTEEFGRFTTAINFLLLVLWNGEVNDYVVFEDQDAWSSKFFFSTFFVLSWIVLLNVVVGVLALSFASVTETLMMMRRPSWSPAALGRDALNVVNRFGNDGGTGRWSLYIEERRQLHATLIDLQAQGIDNFQSGPEYVTLGYLLKRTKSRFHPDYIRLIFHKATQQIGTDNARLRQLRLAHRAINNGVGISQRLKAQSTLVEDLHRTCCIQKSLEIDTIHKVTATNPEYLAVVGDVAALQHILSSQILQLESACVVLAEIAQELDDAERNSSAATRREAAKLLSDRLVGVETTLLAVPKLQQVRRSGSPITNNRIQGEEAVVDTSYLLNMRKLAVQRCEEVDEPNRRVHKERYLLLKHQMFLSSLTRRAELCQGEERGRVIIQFRWDDVVEKLKKSGKWTTSQTASSSKSSSPSNQAYLESIRRKSSTGSKSQPPDAHQSENTELTVVRSRREQVIEEREVQPEDVAASGEPKKKPPPKKKADAPPSSQEVLPITASQDGKATTPKKPKPKSSSSPDKVLSEEGESQNVRPAKPKPKSKRSKNPPPDTSSQGQAIVAPATAAEEEIVESPAEVLPSQSMRIRGENDEATEQMLLSQMPKPVLRKARSFNEAPSTVCEDHGKRTPDVEDEPRRSRPTEEETTEVKNEGGSDEEKNQDSDQNDSEDHQTDSGSAVSPQVSPSPKSPMKKAPPKKSSQSSLEAKEPEIASPAQPHEQDSPTTETRTTTEPTSPKPAPSKRPPPKVKRSVAQEEELEQVAQEPVGSEDESMNQQPQSEQNPGHDGPSSNRSNSAEQQPPGSETKSPSQEEGESSESAQKSNNDPKDLGEQQGNKEIKSNGQSSESPVRNTSFSKAPHSTASPQTKKHKKPSKTQTVATTNKPSSKPAAKRSEEKKEKTARRDDDEAAQRAEEIRALEEEAKQAKRVEDELAEKEWRLQLAANAETKLSEFDEQPMRRRLTREEIQLRSEMVTAAEQDLQEKQAMERSRIRQEKLEEEVRKEREEQKESDRKREENRRQREAEAKQFEQEALVAKRQQEHRELVERRREAERRREEERQFKELQARQEADEKRRAEVAERQRKENLATFELKRQQSLAKIEESRRERKQNPSSTDVSKSISRKRLSPVASPERSKSTLVRNSSVIFSPSREVVPLTQTLSSARPLSPVERVPPPLEESSAELRPSTTVTVQELQNLPEAKQEEVIRKEEDRNLMNRALTRNPIKLDSRGQLKLSFGFADAGLGRPPAIGPQNPLETFSPGRGTSPRSPGSSPVGTPRSSRRPPTMRF